MALSVAPDGTIDPPARLRDWLALPNRRTRLAYIGGEAFGLGRTRTLAICSSADIADVAARPRSRLRRDYPFACRLTRC